MDDMSTFEIFITPGRKLNFPLKILTQAEEEEEEKICNSYALEEKIKELVLFVHGSYDSKPTLIDNFNGKYPEVTKASIERKLKEISTKDKPDSEVKHRLFVHESFLKDLNIVKEANKVGNERLDEFMKEYNILEQDKLQIEREKEEVKRLEREKREKERQIERDEKEKVKLKERQEREAIKEKERLEKETERNQEKE
jgi:hypothetical protein